MNRREIVDYVKVHASHGQTIMRPPYVAVRMSIAWGPTRLWLSGWGFSKQNRYGKTADEWNENIGIEIAKGRALSDLTDQIWHAEQAKMLARVNNLAHAGRLIGAYVPTGEEDAWPTEA